MNLRDARGWLGDTRENLEQRAFTGTIRPNNTDNFARLNVKRYIPQRPEGILEMKRLAVSMKSRSEPPDDFVA